jgi:transposase
MEEQDQRVRFVVAASLGEKPVSQLCAEFGVSRPTGYLWLDRYREGGIAAIAERSRRPHLSPDKTAEELEQRVVLLRQCYPDWGARKLGVLLGRQGIRLHWSGIRHPQTQGKVERFHGSLERALERRGIAGTEPQAWLDAYRLEHNYVRPHEALGMKTPSELWQPSPRRYDPNPAAWEYPEGPGRSRLIVRERWILQAADGGSAKPWQGNGCIYSRSSNDSWFTTAPPWSGNLIRR